MELLKNMDLDFEEWQTPNRAGGMVNKFVRVILKMNGIGYDITPYVIEAYDFTTPRKGSKNHKKVIVNYNCHGFYLSDNVKWAIKDNKNPLTDLLINAFEKDELSPIYKLGGIDNE